MELEEVLSRIAEDRVEFVRFEQTDLHGISRSKTIPAKHVESFARGGLNFLLGQLGFDAQAGVAPGTGYLEDRGFPDSKLFPDPDTYAVLPWADATARLLCTPHFFDGTPAPASPRLAMARLCEALAGEGYRHLAGYEYELYLVRSEDRQPPFTGIQIFATLRNSFDEAFVTEVLRAMPQVGVDIITANAEYGPGQMEINFAPATGVAAADQAFTFKNGIKEIARRHGYMASFMTKPYADQSACGCHLHESLIEIASGRNAFAADDTRYKQWSFAPVSATWALENRSVAIRVKGLAGAGLHTENRVPCGASNPYLVGAAAIAAGLDGLRNHIEPPPGTEGLAYGIEGPTPIPTRLEAALDELEKDTVLRGLLGEELIHLFLAVKRHEVAKTTEQALDYTASDWTERVDDFEVRELFEFL